LFFSYCLPDGNQAFWLWQSKFLSHQRFNCQIFQISDGMAVADHGEVHLVVLRAVGTPRIVSPGFKRGSANECGYHVP